MSNPPEFEQARRKANYGKEQGIAPLSAHVALSALASVNSLTVPDGGARKLLFQVTTGAVRVTFDGTTPTASVGFRFATDATAVPTFFHVSSSTVIKVIEETAGSVVQYQWCN
jgi:hypothetical protein